MKYILGNLSRTHLSLAFLALAALTPLPAQISAPAPASMPAPMSASAPGVTTTAAANTEDIRDIRGPKAVASPVLWFLWIGGGLAAAALAYGAWRWYRHVQTAPKLSYETALARLEKARALMTVPTAREFSIEVSEIVRSYIEARFKVRATHQTTEEFLHNLLEPSDALLAGHQELLGDFLQHCDLAKFARWVLSLEEMEEMYDSARTFISETGKAVTSPKPAVPENRPQTTGVPA
jgi:hypothetical protein